MPNNCVLLCVCVCVCLSISENLNFAIVINYFLKLIFAENPGFSDNFAILDVHPNTSWFTYN